MASSLRQLTFSLFLGLFFPASASPEVAELFEVTDFARLKIIGGPFLVAQRPLTLECVLSGPKSLPHVSVGVESTKVQFSSVRPDWFRNGIAVGDWETENGLSPDSFEIFDNSLRLLGSKTPKELEGLYSCAMTLEPFGSLSSPPVKLLVAEIKKFRGQKITADDHLVMKVPPFSPAFVFCAPPESQPPARLEFEVNGVSLNDLPVEQKENFLITSHGLHIFNFTSTNEGSYRCLARNPASNVTRKSRDVLKFLIETDNTFLLQPPTIIFPSVKDNLVEAKVGSDVIFDCVTYGGGPDAAYWDKFGQVLPRNRSSRFGANLILRNLTTADSGSYVCRSVAGVSRQKFVRRAGVLPRGANYVVYKLAVREPAEVKLQPDVSVSHVSLSCEGRGMTDVQLRFDGRELPNQDLQKRLGVTDMRFDGNNGDQSVTMTFTRPMVSGIYQCIGSGRYPDESDSVSRHIRDLLKEDNLITTQSFRPFADETTFEGSASGITESPSSFSPSVGDLLPIITEGPESANVYEGDVTHLVCRVDSADPAIVFWQKDGKTLTEESAVNWSLIGSGTLQISQLKASDSGRYTCVASNQYGNSTASARLRVSNPLVLLSSGQDETEGEANRDRQISSSQGDSEFMTTVASTDDFDAETVSIGPPELVQMSNKSVMLMWSVPAEAEGRIQFFKIQYKMAKAKSGWVTLREQLPPHVRNHMVGNLMADKKYTFRVAVMFTNNHQTTGKRSEKFLIEAIGQTSRPPAMAPRLIETESIAPSAIRIVWEYKKELDAAADGFLAQLRPYYSASGGSSGGGTFFNVTIKGSETREHILDRLLPATPYEIHLVAFNAAGKGPKSNSVQRSTLAFHSNDQSTNSTTRKATVLDDFGPQLTTGGAHSGPDQTGGVREATGGLFRLDTETLLVIIGAVLGAMLILLVLFMAVCFVRLRRQKDVIMASNGKFNDISKRIHREQSGGLGKQPLGPKDPLVGSIQPVVMPGPLLSRTSNGHTVNLYRNPLDYEDEGSDHYGQKNSDEDSAEDEGQMSSTVDAEEIGGTFSELESPDRRHFDLLNSFGGGTLPSSPQNFLRPSRISNSPSFRGSQRSDSPVAPLVVLPESTRDFWTRSLSPRRATTLDSNGENRPQFATFRPASQARGSPLRTENFLNSTAATGLSSPQRM